jgi:hypothetical protein
MPGGTGPRHRVLHLGRAARLCCTCPGSVCGPALPPQSPAAVGGAARGASKVPEQRWGRRRQRSGFGARHAVRQGAGGAQGAGGPAERCRSGGRGRQCGVPAGRPWPNLGGRAGVRAPAVLPLLAMCRARAPRCCELSAGVGGGVGSACIMGLWGRAAAALGLVREVASVAVALTGVIHNSQQCTITWVRMKRLQVVGCPVLDQYVESVLSQFFVTPVPVVSGMLPSVGGQGGDSRPGGQAATQHGGVSSSERWSDAAKVSLSFNLLTLHFFQARAQHCA